MRGKLISISLICIFAFYLLIAPVNAQKTISVKEFNTNYLFKTGDDRVVSDHVIVSGFIRDISVYERISLYIFNIDDGTGVTVRKFAYFGGLGDIKEGDKVFVEINPSSKSFNVSGVNREIKPGQRIEEWIVISTVSKSLAKSDATPAKPDAASAPKTPGFEILIGAVAVFFAWKNLLKRR